ncbi:unnamed protein product, partial [Rotaria magnacalcarata]
PAGAGRSPWRVRHLPAPHRPRWRRGRALSRRRAAADCRLHQGRTRAHRRPRPDADVRAGPFHRCQCRRAADPGRVPQAHRAQGFRHRRRGDERPDPPGAVSGLDECHRREASRQPSTSL